MCPYTITQSTMAKKRSAERLRQLFNSETFLTISDGKVHDVRAAPQVPIEAEGIYLVDRDPVDFAWLWSIHQTHAFFVTQLKTSIKWAWVLSHTVNKSLGLRLRMGKHLMVMLK